MILLEVILFIKKRMEQAIQEAKIKYQEKLILYNGMDKDFMPHPILLIESIWKNSQSSESELMKWIHQANQLLIFEFEKRWWQPIRGSTLSPFIPSVLPIMNYEESQRLNQIIEQESSKKFGNTYSKMGNISVDEIYNAYLACALYNKKSK